MPSPPDFSHPGPRGEGSGSPGLTHAGQVTSTKSTSFKRDPAFLPMTYTA